MLNDAEIAALVGGLVVLMNALTSYYLNEASKGRAATTQAKVAELHQKVDVVEQAVAAKPGKIAPHG